MLRCRQSNQWPRRWRWQPVEVGVEQSEATEQAAAGGGKDGEGGVQDSACLWFEHGAQNRQNTMLQAFVISRPQVLQY